ncbi:MAG: hypothetical protein Q8O81_18745 [Giesbergeria sp.]|nr:hypothetical protein [Giesbergeria sp.]
MCKPKNLGLLALNKRSGRLSLKACVPKTWAIIVLMWLDFLSALLFDWAELKTVIVMLFFHLKLDGSSMPLSNYGFSSFGSWSACD